MNPKHRIIEHINFMYNWLFKLYIHGVHEFYIEQQMEIVLDSLPEEWDQVRQSLKDRLSALDFNSLVEDMLLERERERAIAYHYEYTTHRSKPKKIGSCC